VFFDMGLAIEAYSIAKERAIRNQRDAINELETQRRVTKNILEDAPLGIIGLDARLQCTECNHVFLEINGSKDRSEVLGKSIEDILPHVDSAIFSGVLRTGQPARATAALLNLTKHASSAVTFFDWAVWPVKDQAGNVSSLVATFADATDRVALQQQREDFVATLTHDLKTPILAANRAIKLLIEGDFGPVAESQKQVMETIHESNDAMYKMVQTLLDVYRYDSGVKRLSLGACDLAAMISALLTELQPLANSRGVTLESRLAPSYRPVTCDHGELRRVIQNLLDNAMKFTPGGGTITVSMEQSGTQTQVAVADTGKGISEDDKPKLFQRFWAAASSGRYYASTGLGLYLCRKIVELHGGRIWVESTLGKGSTFYFTVNAEQMEDKLAPGGSCEQ
jgi:PAS domain S-box-containing protein